MSRVAVDPLDAARHLAEAGVPLFLARPSAESKVGFKLPQGWERTKPDPSVVDRWKPGWALCAVMGHVVDAIDVDPRNGGNIEALEEALGGQMPRVYGKARTPSGGEHYLVASLGVRKVQDLVPGIDLQAGNGEGAGRGFIFLAPTVRESKADGVARPYEWDLAPDLGSLLLEEDESVAGLAVLVEGRKSRAPEVAAPYDGVSYEDLDEEHQKEADDFVNDQLELWQKRFADAVTWPEGKREDGGKYRGWEGLTYQFAWALAKMAASPWMKFDEVNAALCYSEILPEEMAEACPGRWYDGIVTKAESEPPSPPPWEGRTGPEEDFAEAVRSVKKLPPCDHTNESHVTRWLLRQVGTGPLSGLFRRGDEDMIYTPRVGEDGYEPPENPDDHDGPAQVRRMTPLRLASRVDAGFRVFRMGGKKGDEKIDMVFKRDLAERVLADLDRCKNLQRVSMVSHTPLLRADGTVLDEPGYDPESRTLYLPDPGLTVPPVPDEPSERDVTQARDLVLSVVGDFPFVTDHDRANYLGCLLLPLLRNIVPPPYQMLIIGAPQRGSGKSMLAEILRVVHGGVFRSEIPGDEEERRKVITSILDGTSAPVVQFDNVTGTLKSSTMDGLLTNAVWSDRRLGGNENVIVPNNRLWVVTGNNVHIGGDMDRRVLWATINANLEHPELRPPTVFRYPDLPGWLREHRGDVLHALLVLSRAWVVAGRPVDEAPTSDSFGKMQQVLRGILANAGIAGQVAHQDSKPDRPDLEAEEWSAFLQAAHRVMGDEPWTTKALLDTQYDEDGLQPEDLPGDLADKVKHNAHGVAKSLGKLLSSRQGQWASGLKVEHASGGGKHAVKWRVTDEV